MNLCSNKHMNETYEPVHWPHTSYRWRGERLIEPIKCMLSPHTSYRWREERDIEPIKCMRSPHTSYRWRGERVIEPIKCMCSPHTSYRWRGERVIEPIKCMRSPHTSYRWREERDIEPIKCMGIIRRPWLTRPVVAIWPGHRGYTPTLYKKCHGIFNEHRESGSCFNVPCQSWPPNNPHPLDWLYDSLSSPPVAGVWWAHTLDWLYDSLLSTCSWCVVSAHTWLALWLSLLSTCSWCVVSALAWVSCGCCRIIQVDAAHWWWLRHPPTWF